MEMLSSASNILRRQEAIAQGRNLVLCFDGTANQYSDRNTSILKLFTFLEKESPEQLVYYQTGVGTYLNAGYTNGLSRSIGKAIDLGVAWFLDQHVQDGYRFLQKIYEPGDRIYLFGFSRGAYTARALAGMLYTVGLLPRGMPEQVPFAYDIFKKGKESAGYKRAFSRTVTIEFIGVFDTVSSVGAIYPKVLPFSSGNRIARHFRHAMALDEHRAKFRSNPWHFTVDPDVEQEPNQPHAGAFRTTLAHLRHHNSNGKHPTESTDPHRPQHHKHYSKDEKLSLAADRIALDHEEGLDNRPPTTVKEVWFAGCHCDVGGGNAKDTDPHSLANIPLKWMLKEIIAADTGLIFRRTALQRSSIDLEELIDAAERTKVEDMRRGKIRHKTFEATVRVTETPGAQAVDVDNDRSPTVPEMPRSSSPTSYAMNEEKTRTDSDGKKAREDSLMTQWMSSTGAKDAVCEITDELKVAPGWWILEFLPFMDNNQNEHGHWQETLRMNLFRSRNIPRPPAHTNPNSRHNNSDRGVAVSDAPALFHISVKQRMESEDCNTSTWKSFWKKKTVPYKPRAWPRHGDPVYVE